MPNIKNDKEFQTGYELNLTYNSAFKNERKNWTYFKL